MTEYEIFKSCFPALGIDQNSFQRLTFADNPKLFRTENGFAVCQGDRITMLCTASDFSGRGEGSRLLSQCEEYIKSHGGARVSLGGEIIPGAAESSRAFFAKRGYKLSDTFCEMELPLRDFVPPPYSAPADVKFGFYEGDISALRSAAAAVDEEWVQYFEDGGCFFCGFHGEDTAAFCILGEDECCALSDGKSKIGSIGCVGTLPQFRRKGLGLQMTALVADYLKSRGCDSVFIHYTHLEHWYAKLGARTFLRFAAAEKELL